MTKESENQRRFRKAKEARDRRRKRGLKIRGDGGGAGKNQGRKLLPIERPICCGELMGSWGNLRWKCRGSCKKTKPK